MLITKLFKICCIVFLCTLSLFCSAAKENNKQKNLIKIAGGKVMLMKPADFIYPPPSEVFGPPYYSWPRKKIIPNETHNITYVVYQGVDSSLLKKEYKIDPVARVDFRYIRYTDAISYLVEQIEIINKSIERINKEVVFEDDRSCASRDLLEAYDLLNTYNKTALNLFTNFGSINFDQ